MSQLQTPLRSRVNFGYSFLLETTFHPDCEVVVPPSSTALLAFTSTAPYANCTSVKRSASFACAGMLAWAVKDAMSSNRNSNSARDPSLNVVVRTHDWKDEPEAAASTRVENADSAA